MCEYQRIEENKPPMCEYTKELCTYCVLGNRNTYEEAEKALEGYKENTQKEDKV